ERNGTERNGNWSKKRYKIRFSLSEFKKFSEFKFELSGESFNRGHRGSDSFTTNFQAIPLGNNYKPQQGEIS
ncbi:MAG: hypothetical protein FWH22_09420, partial [Fibromonadales bacterium]|nr:hypothetical protein [Fibromonadales bacterium]